MNVLDFATAFQNLALAAQAAAAGAQRTAAALGEVATRVRAVFGQLIMRMAIETTGVTEADIKRIKFDPETGEMIVHLWNWRRIVVTVETIKANVR